MPGLPRVVWVGLAAIGGGVAVGLFGPRAGPSEIAFLAVGQGDCTVIRHRGATLLIDVGPASPEFDAGARVVAPKLRTMGVDRIDLVLLTHPDTDHIGGLAGLAQRIPIERLGVSSEFRRHPDLLAALRSAKIDASEVWWIPSDSRVQFQDLSLFVRAPKISEGDNDNEGSLFIEARLLGTRVVLTGDAGEATEIVQAGRGNWRAELLKAGHHGSAGSTSSVWLNEVQPREVVISCGANNRFGHPAAATLNRIRAAGAKVARTDLEGDIRYVLEGGRFARESR